jgi:1-deoxy-D-xylulose-5-phosphate reductoisomerase
MKKISIFGSTGSIGQNTIEIISKNPEKFQIISLVAKSNVKTLISQAKKLQPNFVVIEDERYFAELKEALRSLKKCEVLCGAKAIAEIAKIRCDLFVASMVGSIGVIPVLNAIKAKSNIALANKESLVCAGDLLIKEAKKNSVKIIPIDSEHNAIFQVFEKENIEMIENVVLTASGGPFFNSKKDPKNFSIKEALNHPNWQMGAKISIDSATMMNKGLEMIEAYHLFPVEKEQIKILVHPQSIVHGMVNYLDGSSLAMLSLPDMKTPISFALAYPKRMEIKYQKLDLTKIKKLEFFSPDEKKFPAIKICREVLRVGKSYPAIMNAANEIAVERFLKQEISFDQITKIVEKTINKFSATNITSVDEILEIDQQVKLIAKSI